MFAVMFEVRPKPECWDRYLALAAELRPILVGMDGFLENERFRSLRREGWLLSLSAWADEKAVIRWRTQARHHEIQGEGRSDVFEDYHLRVGEVILDTHVPEGQTLRELRFDETEVGTAKAVTVTELLPGEVLPGEVLPGTQDGALPHTLWTERGLPTLGSEGVVAQDLFESITRPGKLLVLTSWRDAAAAKSEPQPQEALTGANQIRYRRIRVVRDYGMFERREAPQYYPGVVPAARRPSTLPS